MNNFLIITNPTSGLKKGLLILEQVILKLNQNNIQYYSFISKYKHHALDYILNENILQYKNIIIIGGDGTYNEVINGILQREDNYRPILGFIPAGSGNSLMHDLNCLDPHEAISNILNFNVKKLDVMKLNLKNKIEYAFNIVGWGMATDIGVLSEKLRWLGPSRYTIASLLHIVKLNKRLCNIIIDNKEYNNHYIFILVCNTIHTGNAMMAAPRAKIDDGLLDIIILNKDISRFKLLQLLPLLFKGKHIKSSYVDYKTGKRIKLHPRIDEILNIDGEIKSYTPISISVLKNELSFYG